MHNNFVDIQITSDEPLAGYFASKFIEAGFKPKIEKMPTGDFIIFGKVRKDAILIERKSPQDFLGSIEGKKDSFGAWEKGRIWNQLERMVETGIPELTVLIEGNPINKRFTVYRKKGFTKNRIWGAMRAIRKYGVGIHIVKDRDDLVDYLIYLMRGQTRPKRPFSLRVSPPNKLSLKDKKLYLLQGLPGVGPKTSSTILSKHGSVMNFFKNLDKSSAIGDKYKAEIKKILNSGRANGKKKAKKSKKRKA